MGEMRFENVGVGYGESVLISGIDLEVEKGEILGLVGPNGAGKSTILKTAAGLLEPVSGRILLKGKTLSEIRRNERAKIMSVMLTGKINLRYETCYDVIRVGRFQYTDVFGRLSEKDRKAIDDAIELIGIGELKNREFGRLSDGQRQRVLLARAIVSEPELLIMDEPTTFLDMGYKTEFFDVLKNYVKSRNASVIISMHEIELVRKVADRIVCITKDNTIDKIGSPEEIMTPSYLETLFSMTKGKYQEYYE